MVQRQCLVLAVTVSFGVREWGSSPPGYVTFGKSFDLSKPQYPDLVGIFVSNGLSGAPNIAGLQPTLGIAMLWTGETEEQTK